MKDALGHGSNPHGGPHLRPDGRSVIPSRPFRYSDGDGPRNATDQDAQEALKNSVKSEPAAVHPAFGRRTSIPTEQKYAPGQHPVEKYRGNPL